MATPNISENAEKLLVLYYLKSKGRLPPFAKQKMEKVFSWMAGITEEEADIAQAELCEHGLIKRTGA